MITIRQFGFRLGITGILATVWTIMIPFVFFSFLNELNFVDTLLSNMGSNIYDAKDFVFWIGLMGIVSVGFLWMAGLFDWIFD